MNGLVKNWRLNLEADFSSNPQGLFKVAAAESVYQ
jgi:hypothetical protein